MQMQTEAQKKAQTMNDINYVINVIQRNKPSFSLSPPIFFSPHNKEILTVKNYFYLIVDNLTAEFTEQELCKIETDLLFFYAALKELIDSIKRTLQTQNQSRRHIFAPPVNPPEVFTPVTLHEVESSIIQQEDVDKFAAYIQLRIEGITKELEKKQKMQRRHIAEIFNLYSELVNNSDQKMMAMDEQLYVKQIQRQDAEIRNIIDVLDGV